MYLYSSDTNCLKIMLSKSDAEQFILNQPTLTMRKNIILAIFKAALPKSKFAVYKGSIAVRLLEHSKDNFILEFTQKKQIKLQQKNKSHCYYCENLKEVKSVLKRLISINTKNCKLFYKDNKYYILSEKYIDIKLYSSSEYIEQVLEEYAHLISKNADKEIVELL